MRKGSIAPLCLLLLAALRQAPAQAQTSPRLAAEQPTIRYHFGDNPAWASPTFDDSAWPIAPEGQVPAPLYNSDGFVWIRARVIVPPGFTGPLSLRSLAAHAGPDVQQLFVNGQSVGQFGAFPPSPDPVLVPQTWTLDLPVATLQPAQAVEVVLRGWNMPINHGRRSHIIADFTIDRADLQHALVSQTRAESLIVRAPIFAVDLLLEVLGIGVLLLGFWSRRRELKLYALWLVVMPLFLASIAILPLAAGLNLRLFQTAFIVINAIGMGVVVEFIWTTQKFRAPFLRTVLHICWISDNIASILAVVLVHPGPLASTALFFDIWLLFAFNVISASALLWGLFVTGHNRAIAAAMLLINVGYFLRWSGNPIHFAQITFFEAAFYLSSFVIATLLIHQTWAAWKESDGLRVEFAAARELQQQLVPLALPSIPGLRLEAAYMPANDVGGDFYQVLPQLDGTTLVLLGDVSGKGLKAAMTGVLTIGAACALSTEAPTPAALLTRLNREMTRFHRDGFVTCLCLRITPDGTTTLANAGHLAPYRHGQEIPVDSGLPLGLTPFAEYIDTTLHLAPGETLTLLTDGVLEARNPTGDLLGFEHTATLSRQSAAEIARAAQQFGQDDDITVLTLTRLAVN